MKKYVGLKIGRLTLIEKIYAEPRNKWRCLCDCGNEKIIAATNLDTRTKSCGCLRKEVSSKQLLTLERVTFKKGKGSCNFLWNSYKQTAKSKNLIFDLNKDDFESLTSKNCHYCGSAPSKIITGQRSNGSYVYNGLDRMDNNIGYILSNVITCCYICNYAKRDMPYADFKNWIEQVRNGKS